GQPYRRRLRECNGFGSRKYLSAFIYFYRYYSRRACAYFVPAYGNRVAVKPVNNIPEIWVVVYSAFYTPFDKVRHYGSQVTYAKGSCRARAEYIITRYRRSK